MSFKNSRFTNSFILFLLLLSVLELSALTLCRPDFYGLQGTYYDNTEWKDQPLATSLDSSFSRDTLGTIRAKASQNKFSVDWSGYINIPETDVYSFATRSDDGSHIYIDNNIVVDNGGPHGAEEVQGTIHLIKGLHRIKIRYVQFGGFAVLDVAWAQGDAQKAPLQAKSLLLPTINTASFWIFQKATIIFPFLLTLWVFVILWFGFSTYRIIRTSKKSLFYRHLDASSFLGTYLDRLFLQPLAFAGQQIKQPPVYHWVFVGGYSAVIFLTLSYARKFSNYMQGTYGNDVFSYITVTVLSLAGLILFIYLVALRDKFLSRFASFAAIGLVYGFILSPGLRVHIFTLLQAIGMNTHFWETLDIYPIVAAEKVHFLEYGLLGLVLCKTLRYHIKNKTAYFLAIVLVYIIGMTDEGLQWALPSRVGEYRDIWINVVSGGLAVAAVWLVIRPQVFKQKFQSVSLRPLFYMLAAAIMYTGIFLQVAHGFGSPIFMPDSGTEFISAFSEYELLEIDKHRVLRFQGKSAEDTPANDIWLFTHEARRHQYLRDRHYQNLQYYESYCEQEILRTYYRSYLMRKPLGLLDYELDTFNVFPNPDEYVFYKSSAQDLAITVFSQRTMWTMMSLSALFFCLLATMLPASQKTLLRLRAKGKEEYPHRRFESRILRPVFVASALLIALINIYSAQKTRPSDYTNLLILTVDSCQPDYWGAYGYEKNTTPFFDKLASEGVLFTNAIVSTSWTIPSLTSMLTGLNPNVHGIEVRGKLMDKRIPTLFEILEKHGYSIGDTSYTLTEPSINSVFKKGNISPDVALSEGRSEESYLLSWMEQHKEQPFFGWVHFHTSHLPYNATPPYNQLFLDGIDPDVLTDKQIEFVKSQLAIHKGEVEFDEERQTDAIRALYAQTLRQQDAKIGKVFQKLNELGLRENTLVVITADHGDELFEHGFIGHASTSWDASVYDDLVNVPLLIYYPEKFPKAQRIDNQVRMIDIMPTVLDILGIPLEAKIQGKSYLPLIQGTGDFQETAFSETTPCGYSCPKRLEKNRRRSVRTNEWKLIAVYDDDTKETNYELYHLQNDRRETQNVVDEYPEITAQFKQEMRRWMEEEPKKFAYQHQQTEEEHYLDVDVEVRPIVVFPKVGTVLSPETYNKRVLVEWIGDNSAEYIIEYEVGAGDYHMTGELEVVGTKQWYGPFPEDIWQSLPLYNPWKFRIIPKRYPKYPSDWITFEMKYK